MPFIKLTMQCSIYQPPSTSAIESTRSAYEPLYVNSDNIETLFESGITIVRMASGERFDVIEKPEAILALINQCVQRVSHEETNV